MATECIIGMILCSQKKEIGLIILVVLTQHATHQLQDHVAALCGLTRDFLYRLFQVVTCRLRSNQALTLNRMKV